MTASGLNDAVTVSDQGMPPHSRLLRPEQFKQVFARGRRLPKSPLGVVYTANVLGLPRIGLALAKKSVPLAVRRNRIKRLLRESFRKQRRVLPSVDVVFYAQPALSGMPDEQLRAYIESVWAELRRRCGSC